MNRPHLDEPTLSADQIRKLVHKETSMRSRLIQTSFLLLNLTALTLLCSLWWTEPALPARTHAAFAVLALIVLGWVLFFGWVLTRRRPLYGLDRVIAARMALGFTTLSLVGTTAVAATRGSTPAVIAAALSGTLLVACAAAMYARARSTRRELLRRRDELAMAA